MFTIGQNLSGIPIFFKKEFRATSRAGIEANNTIG